MSQEIIANVAHLTGKLVQNATYELLPKETNRLELSVYSSLPATEAIVTEGIPAKRTGDKSSETLCDGHINEMTKNTV